MPTTNTIEELQQLKKINKLLEKQICFLTHPSAKTNKEIQGIYDSIGLTGDRDLSKQHTRVSIKEVTLATKIQQLRCVCCIGKKKMSSSCNKTSYCCWQCSVFKQFYNGVCAVHASADCWEHHIDMVNKGTPMGILWKFGDEEEDEEEEEEEEKPKAPTKKTKKTKQPKKNAKDAKAKKSSKAKAGAKAAVAAKAKN